MNYHIHIDKLQTMKKKVYFTILVAIILITIYQIIFLSFKSYVWGVGVLAFWIWVKNDITEIIGWLTDKKIQKRTSEKQQIVDLPDFEIQRKSYIELVKICCSTESQQKLTSFFETLKDHKDDKYYGTTLEYVIDFLTKNNYCFIEKLDWKQAVEDLQLYLEAMVQKNYNVLKIDFPKTSEKNESLFLEDVFETYNKCLEKQGLQMGFIDTQSDEYVFFVHEIVHKQEIINLINSIGYNYQEK